MKIIHKSNLSVVSKAIRYSHYTHDKSDTLDVTKIGEKDYDLIKRVAFAKQHASVLEHFRFIVELDLNVDFDCYIHEVLHLNKYAKMRYMKSNKIIYESNLRVIFDNRDVISVDDIKVLLGDEIGGLFE